MKLAGKIVGMFLSIGMILCFLACRPSGADDLEKQAKRATSPEEIFEASFHINWYLTDDFERVGIDRSFQFLTNKLYTGLARERDEAASSLRWLNHPQKNQVLVEAYGREKEEDVQLGILFALCNTNSTDEAVHFLSSRIQDRQFPHRWSAWHQLKAGLGHLRLKHLKSPLGIISSTP